MTSSDEKRDLLRNYWRAKSLLRLALEQPEVVLKQEAKIIDVIVELSHAAADAQAALEAYRMEREG